jgi:GT2 family glycosyltransferase/glycosyltransferase involved in cell wall biosynthesis
MAASAAGNPIKSGTSFPRRKPTVNRELKLQAALEAAEARIREYERSTFWRLTYPLRYLADIVKGTHRKMPRAADARVFAPGVPPAPALATLEREAGPLHVPSADSPQVSVIVPTFGHDLHTFTCLKALARQAARVPLEVIVMDDGAPFAARHALPDVTGVRFERNALNLGYVRNCNRGAQLARGEYLLFLNNDAVVTPGTIEALLEVFLRHPQAGAAGARLVYPDGRLQEAGAIVWRDGTAWNYGRGDDPARPEYRYLREADYCSAACLLVPRALFHDVGGFDERYAPAYCEDADLAFKLRRAGRPVYYQPEATVVHFEGVSHGTDVGGGGVKRHQAANQAKLRERWSRVLAAHRDPGVLPGLERDRGARRRVLFVEESMLTPDQDSGSLRTWRLLLEMKRQGCHVIFAASSLEGREPYASELRRLGIEVLHRPHVASIEAFLEERGFECDVVVLARYYVALRHIAAVRRYAPGALLVLDTVDVHYLRQRRLAALEASSDLAQSAQAIYAQETDCMRRCDVTWVVSEAEREMLALEVPRATVMVQSNIHSVHEGGPAFSQREGLLFVGNYRHPPNVDAAIWLAREIVPRLRKRLPGVVTYLVGSDPGEAVRALGGDGIEVVGHVPDIDAWLDRSRVCLAPLRYGAGVKGKVNHAMSRGLPVVATPVAVEGMHLVDGEEGIVANDPDAFADAVARVYRDEALWNRLALGGRQNVRRHFSPEAAAAGLVRLFDLADRRPHG